MAANKRANVRQRGPFCPVWFRHLTALFDSFARDAEGIITARGGSRGGRGPRPPMKNVAPVAAPILAQPP